MLKRFLSALLVFALIFTAIPVFAEEAVVVAEEVVVEEVAVGDADGEAAEEESEDESEAEAPAGYVAYQRGDRDAEDSAGILMIQTKLIELGYLRDSADGVYGLNTETAVEAFQRNNGLDETGVADEETQEKLLTGTNLVTSYESMDPESVTFRVQEKLAQWGFLKDAPDGKAGKKTLEAIEEFKTYLYTYLQANPTATPVVASTPAPGAPSGFGDAAIPVDEPIESTEYGAVNSDMMAFVEGEEEFNVYRQTLESGDRGEEVLRVQRRLHNLKYLYITEGEFNEDTERALLYFQRKNGLSQTAVADEETQRVLFSAEAVESEEFVGRYKLVIDVSDQRVYVFQWNGSDYDTCINEMICSTGMKNTPTPLGTFQAAGPTGTGEWYWFKDYEVYAKWATRIVGGILFHSVVYSKGKSLNKTSVKKLGRPASHGCIRLEVENAKWIYDNCPPGTTVVIEE